MTKKLNGDDFQNKLQPYEELANFVWPRRANIDLGTANFYLQEAKEMFKDCNSNVDHWDNRRFQMIVAYTGYTSFSVFKIAEHFSEKYDCVLILFISIFLLAGGILLAVISLMNEKLFHYVGSIPQWTITEERIACSLKDQVLLEALSYQHKFTENRKVGRELRKDFLGLLIMFLLSISMMAIYLAFRAKISST